MLKDRTKQWNMWVTVIPFVNGALGTITKGLVQRLETKKKKTSEDHPNHSIVEIGQNTEKILGELRRLAVVQTLVRNHQILLVWQTLIKNNHMNGVNIDKYQDLAREQKMLWNMKVFVIQMYINALWTILKGLERD